MRSLPSAVAALLCLLALPALGWQVDGVVTGTSSQRTLWVSALRTRDLRVADALVVTAPTSGHGRFSLPIPEGEREAYLVVTEACDPRVLGCTRYLPRVEPVMVGEGPIRLEVPDAAVAQAIWTGAGLEPGPARTVGLMALGLLAAVAGWFWRRGPDVAHASGSVVGVGLRAWELAALGAGFVAVGAVRLGSEPFDLLEYSYVHEALRPTSFGAILSDPISAELAHGPVMPVLLRAVGAVSTSPWWLRAPSLLFGAVFVVLIAAVLGRALGRSAGWLGGALAAVSPVALYYARDATPYALCGALASAAIALVELPQRHSLWRWGAFALVHALGFFAHYGFAFFSAAQGLGLLVVGARARPRMLAWAAMAFLLSAVGPVLLAPHFERMLAASGLRFGLMAGAYPVSPGLAAFAGRIAAVVAGVSGEHAWTIVVWLVPAIFGARALRSASPTLLWQACACVVATAVWLVFSHTMSVSYGGGRIYWAFRWARPLLGGFVVLAGASAVSRVGRWSALVLLGLGVVLDVVTVAPPVRPAQAELASAIRADVRPGDAYAVLPASFYGDPIQFYMAEGQPAAWLTSMKTADLDVGDQTIRGPIVELGMPIETAMDRLEHERLWVVGFDEHMFATRKFSDAPRSQALAALRGPLGWTEVRHVALPFIDAWLFVCDADCAWEGTRRLMVPLVSSVRAERFLARPAGTEGTPFDLPLTLVLPEETAALTVRTGHPAAAGSLQIVGDAVAGPVEALMDGESTTWRARLRAVPGRARVRLESASLSAVGLTVAFERSGAEVAP